MSNLISPQTTALADVNAGAAELSSLAVFGGGKPAFSEPLHIGRPNLGNREVMLRRVNEIFDRRWFTNDGPLVKEFEARIQELVGVKHCIAMCNATIALEIAIRALELDRKSTRLNSSHLGISY